MPTPEETARQIEAIKKAQNLAAARKTETVLYLAVLPLVHMSTGLTEQTLTLYPDRKFATEFLPDEVEGYVNFFARRARQYLVGGQVVDYEFHQEPMDDGRVVVKVVQIVER